MPRAPARPALRARCSAEFRAAALACAEATCVRARAALAAGTIACMPRSPRTRFAPPSRCAGRQRKQRRRAKRADSAARARRHALRHARRRHAVRRRRRRAARPRPRLGARAPSAQARILPNVPRLMLPAAARHRQELARLPQPLHRPGAHRRRRALLAATTPPRWSAPRPSTACRPRSSSASSAWRPSTAATWATSACIDALATLAFDFPAGASARGRARAPSSAASSSSS